VADVVDVTLANHEVFTQRHAHKAKVTLIRYKRPNGIPSPFGNDTNNP
jgi:hypothetical protein